MGGKCNINFFFFRTLILFYFALRDAIIILISFLLSSSLILVCCVGLVNICFWVHLLVGLLEIEFLILTLLFGVSEWHFHIEFSHGFTLNYPGKTKALKEKVIHHFCSVVYFRYS